VITFPPHVNASTSSNRTRTASVAPLAAAGRSGQQKPIHEAAEIARRMREVDVRFMAPNWSELKIAPALAATATAIVTRSPNRVRQCGPRGCRLLLLRTKYAR